ncbi:MAG: hypothetical protein A2Z14_07920 [Chloroflexi bacterium RBG_16_48_8]|nr:MAG: hypothetical protein A2Z14_07920 [Chloroflexi bacterium RBG_16_48_8]
MIRKPTWIMLAVFVLLLIFAILWPQFRPQETVSEITPSPEPPWSALASNILGVKVENFEKGKTLELQKDGEGLWTQIVPIQGQADGELVEQSISWLASPIVDRELSTEGGLDQFGFTEPSGIITVTFADGASNILLVGDVTATGSVRYVIIPHSSKVLLIDKFDVNSVLEMVDVDWLLAPLPEEIEADGTETPVP